MKIDNPAEMKALGENLLARIEHRIRRQDYATDAIQSIAREELEALDCELVYQPKLWLDFIQATSVAQAVHRFSDVPLTLARNRNIQVQLLCWNAATTDIHAHAFCGAFRVMQGSSVHTRYRFDEGRWLSERLGLGRLCCLGSEYLARGSVREIKPGRDGLLHSLFHLDSPSLTLLVRTHTTVSAKPQLGFYEPGLAIDHPGLVKDEEIIHLSRLFSSVLHQGHGEVEALMLRAFSDMDSARLIHLCLAFAGSLAAPEARKRVVGLVDRRHGKELATCLDQVMSKVVFQTRIKAARRTVEDAEIRFFLALLLNVRDRSTLFELVRARFPERDPVIACAEWLLGLSRVRAGATAFMQEVAARAEGPGYRLGSRIASRIPSSDDLSTVEAWLRTDHDPAASSVQDNRLRDLPELEPLFRS